MGLPGRAGWEERYGSDRITSLSTYLEEKLHHKLVHLMGGEGNGGESAFPVLVTNLGFGRRLHRCRGLGRWEVGVSGLGQRERERQARRMGQRDRLEVIR